MSAAAKPGERKLEPYLRHPSSSMWLAFSSKKGQLRDSKMQNWFRQPRFVTGQLWWGLAWPFGPPLLGESETSTASVKAWAGPFGPPQACLPQSKAENMPKRM